MVGKEQSNIEHQGEESLLNRMEIHIKANQLVL